MPSTIFDWANRRGTSAVSILPSSHPAPYVVTATPARRNADTTFARTPSRPPTKDTSCTLGSAGIGLKSSGSLASGKNRAGHPSFSYHSTHSGAAVKAKTIWPTNPLVPVHFPSATTHQKKKRTTKAMLKTKHPYRALSSLKTVGLI